MFLSLFHLLYTPCDLYFFIITGVLSEIDNRSTHLRPPCDGEGGNLKTLYRTQCRVHEVVWDPTVDVFL